MRSFLCFLGIFAVFSTAILTKRASNSYGDETVVSQGGGAQMESAPEMSTARVHQTSYPHYSAGVQSSGYRRIKRAGSNSYGDEQVLPAGGAAQEAYRPVVEQASAQVQQYPSKTDAAVVSSGYR